MLISFLLLGTTMLAAGSAVNAQGDFCQRNRVCIYDDNDYEAILGARRPGGAARRTTEIAYRLAHEAILGARRPGGGLRNTSDAADDKMDSWRNRTRRNAAWYSDSGGNGDCHNMIKRKRNPNLSTGPSDELSSWRTNRKC